MTLWELTVQYKQGNADNSQGQLSAVALEGAMMHALQNIMAHMLTMCD